MLAVTYRTNLDNVAWAEMKATLRSDAFDNGRSPEQLKKSFENSYATCIAYVDNRIIGTARVLSDGVCNAYIIDVWTLTTHRRQGVASVLLQILLAKLKGQHVYLFSDDTPEFYRKIGFTEQPVGMSKMMGKWLINE